MISDSHKFIFVHIPKCAGTSIRAVLEPYARINLYQTEYRKMRKGIFSRMRRDYFQVLVEEPELHVRFIKRNTRRDFFMFGFVRNPYSRTVSLWKYLKADLTFEEFLDWLQNEPAKSYHDLAHIKSCAFYVKTYSGLFENRFIGRMENIQADFSAICDRIKVDSQGLSGLDVLNATNHEHHSKYYNSASEEVVRSIYAEDFSMFNYEA